MKATADPLDELVADTKGVSREKLVEILRGKVNLSADGGFLILPGFRTVDRNARHIVLVALLAQLAVSLRTDGVSPALTPKDLEKATGLKGGTIRPAVKSLKGKGLVVPEGKAYAMHASALNLAQQELEGASDD